MLSLLIFSTVSAAVVTALTSVDHSIERNHNVNTKQGQTQTKNYNILFVVSDDLRPELGGLYGEGNIIHTPNIDAFMSSGFTFTHAYCQQALCAPSRASFLTSLRPDSTRVWTIGPYFRDTMVNQSGATTVTLPQYFKEHGAYYTVGSGKIFHPGSPSGGNESQCEYGEDVPYSWTNTTQFGPYWYCGQTDGGKFASPAMADCPPYKGRGCVQDAACIACLTSFGCWGDNSEVHPAFCVSDCAVHCYPDGAVADQTLAYFDAIAQNESMQQKGTPWFVAVGLKRPHLGFFAPEQYYNLYGLQTNFSGIAIAKYRDPPKHMPTIASNNCSEIKNDLDVQPHLYQLNYTTVDNKTVRFTQIRDEYHSYLRGAYYASVTFMDAQFGRIMDALDAYGYANTTVVSFIGDHGWSLGEQGLWTKHTNFELSARVPMVIRFPEMAALGIAGGSSDVLVESLDLFPTLIQASGVGFTDHILTQLEGKSLYSLMVGGGNNTNVDAQTRAQPQQLAYNQYARSSNKKMGISIRSTQWRYTEWLKFDPGSVTESPTIDWDVSYGTELYNHSNVTGAINDLNAYENYNFAYDEDMQGVVQQMHDLLFQTWDNQSTAINWRYQFDTAQLMQELDVGRNGNEPTLVA